MKRFFSPLALLAVLAACSAPQHTTAPGAAATLAAPVPTATPSSQTR
ncbi:lipoprotein [Hymenobacter sp. 5516J-16]|nr:lipoprotein [Hymenobacter sp. 5516J-16]UOQ78039.1 lipoprotein [Hymenobacter sp. 5516J-16]